MIKHIIFDFFGVMVSEPAHKEREIWSELLGIKQEVLNPVLNKYRELCNKGKINSNQFRESVHKDLNIDIIYDADTMFLKTLEEVKPYNEMFELVPKLKKMGYRCSILSDIFPTDKEYVSKQGRYDEFDDIILSCDIGLSKSDDNNKNTQKIFKYALNKYNMDPKECIFIDDRLQNCETANKAGINTIQAIKPTQVIQDLSSILGFD